MLIPVIKVSSSPEHPTATKTEKIVKHFPDYSWWNSLANFLRFKHEQKLNNLWEWIMLLNKEAPYSNWIDFMSLMDIPWINLEINFRWKEYIFNLENKFSDIIKTLDLNKENIENDFVLEKDIELAIKFLKTKYNIKNIKLFIEKDKEKKYVDPNTPISELAPVSWLDLNDKQKEKLQNLIKSFFKKTKWKNTFIGFNYTSSKTQKDWAFHPQSLKNLHIHFSEQDEPTWEKELTIEEETAFHDNYISKAFLEEWFNPSKFNFSTLKIKNNKKIPLQEQWIIFEIKEFWTQTFWKEFNEIIDFIEKFNLKNDSFENYIKALNNIKLSKKYKSVLEDNENLFKKIISWIKEIEKWRWKYNRRKNWIFMPFPKFWYTVSIRQNKKWKKELKIVPRIHTRWAVVESLWMKLERIASESKEKFDEILKQRKENNKKIIEEITK